MNVVNNQFSGAILPMPSPTPPPGVADMVNTIAGWVMYFGAAAVLFGLLGGAIALAIANKRGEAPEHIRGFGYVFVAGGIVTSAGAIAGALTGVSFG